MAVKERQTRIIGCEIHLDLTERFDKHDILQNAGRRLAIHLRQLERIAMKMQRMSVVCLVIECKAVARASLQNLRLIVYIEDLAVDCPVN